MTISSLLTTITGEIAALSITGVTIKDYDEVVVNWKAMPNVLYPNVENFLTGLKLDYESFPHGASAQVNISYTLNYRFLGTQVGNNTATYSLAYKDVIDKVLLIINAIVTNHSYASGKASVELAGVKFGGFSDPSGAFYHGADIALSVVEMQNT
jgi:hypothetical protein